MYRGRRNIRETENEFISLCLCENILIIKYKPSIRIDWAVSNEIYEFRMRFQNGKTYPVLCHINGLVDYNKHACDHTDFMGLSCISAIGYVGDLPGSWSLVDYYIKAYKPTIPSFLTNTPEEAMEFLKRYM